MFIRADKLTQHTLPTDQLFNLEFQFESVFNLEFQPKFSIQLGIPIPMGIALGECTFRYFYEFLYLNAKKKPLDALKIS